MNSSKFVTFLIAINIGLFCNVQGQTNWGKKTRCLSTPIMSSKVEKSIKKCQEEVKVELIEDTLTLYNQYRENLEAQLHAQAHSIHEINDQHHVTVPEQYASEPTFDEIKEHPDFYTTHGFDTADSVIDESRKTSIRTTPVTRATRHRRDADEWYHPTLISHEDKWIAGCLMQCIYRKNNAVDKHGWPTLDGLVALYTEGVNEQGYFMNALRSVNTCLNGASKKHKVNRNEIATRGPLCEVSFDVFDCISDKITEYCSGHHN
uniref:CSON014434 protein n=1 Tax=Culicoides sonorensis TaxID=179676 RepID=A0A336K135_CULSO